MAVVPVLMYHHINPVKGDMVTVTPEAFASQMRHLAESGYTTLSLAALMDFIEGRSRVEPGAKCVAVTFDDGYLDNYIYAWPVLKEFGIKAAVFVVTGWADRASKAGRADIEGFIESPPTHKETKREIEDGNAGNVVMDWTMMREMAQTGLVEFASHTVTHADCGALSAGELGPELAESKRVMELELKSPCEYLCWPRGRHNQAAVEAAKEVGYRGVFTTSHGVVEPGSDPFAIKRIVVKQGVSWFKRRLKVYTSPVLSRLYSRVKSGR